jgi:hypothetical protein
MKTLDSAIQTSQDLFPPLVFEQAVPPDDCFSRAQGRILSPEQSIDASDSVKPNQAETSEVARPTRHILLTLADMPVHFVKEISPASLMLKDNVKLPLVMLMLSAGI